MYKENKTSRPSWVYSRNLKINVFHHNNRLKEKNYILISRNAENSLDKIQQLFMTLKKL